MNNTLGNSLTPDLVYKLGTTLNYKNNNTSLWNSLECILKSNLSGCGTIPGFLLLRNFENNLMLSLRRVTGK